jgi:hypothetical protein
VDERVSRFFNLFLSLVPILLLVCCTGSDVSPAADGTNKSKPVARAPLSQTQVKELKDIGALVGRGDPFDKIENSWKSFIKKEKDIDIQAAVDVVTREAVQEAPKNPEPSTKRLQQLISLKDAVNDELSRARGLLAAAKERRQKIMINKKEFDVDGDPPKVTIKSGEVIGSQAEVAGYVKELEARLKSIDNDARAASMEVSNMTQKRQAALKNLPATAKKLREIARNIKQG